MVAGSFATATTYPFDLLRTRFAIQGTKKVSFLKKKKEEFVFIFFKKKKKRFTTAYFTRLWIFMRKKGSEDIIGDLHLLLYRSCLI